MFQLMHPAVDIAIVCADFDASLRFYRDVLGLEVVFDLQVPAEFSRTVGLGPEGFRQVRLAAGHTRIKLMEFTHPPAHRSPEFAAGVRWLTFIVEDVQSTVSRLKERGVRFLSEPERAPDAAGVVCTVDPDGILIEFVQV